MKPTTEEPTMKIKKLIAASCLGLCLMASAVSAGPLDPDCTAEKAAKSAATKATVGVGGRCSPAEAAKDTGKKAVGVEDKGPIEKATSKNDKPVEKAKDKAK
jgi:hypothetical protein